MRSGALLLKLGLAEPQGQLLTVGEGWTAPEEYGAWIGTGSCSLLEALKRGSWSDHIKSAFSLEALAVP